MIDLNLFIDEYTKTTNLNKNDAFNFLIKNKKLFPKQLYKEAILNFRIIYCKNQNNKIYNSYIKNIIKKNSWHNSDLAMGYNILKFIKLNKNQEEEIINYLFDRILLLKKFPDNLTLNLKKYYILNFIFNNILKFKD